MKKLFLFLFTITTFYACNNQAAESHESTDSAAPGEVVAVDTAAVPTADTIRTVPSAPDSMKPAVIRFEDKRKKTDSVAR